MPSPDFSRYGGRKLLFLPGISQECPVPRFKWNRLQPVGFKARWPKPHRLKPVPLGRSLPGFLPDLHPVCRGEIEFFSRLDVERRVPRVDVPHGIRAELRRRVRVSHHLLAELCFSRLGSPGLSKGDEELLVAGESVLHRGGYARERSMVAIIGGRETRDVGDVFSDGLLSVYGDVGEWLVGIV